MNKKAQFFILSAVIIASIIVSLASVKNYAATGDAPKKFYYYSQQLEDETGAVVDYALYSDPTGDNVTVKENLNKFLQQSIDKTLAGYPEMQIFACYSDTTDSNNLVCQNNGTRSVKINVTTSSSVSLSGTKEKVCTTLFGVTQCSLQINSIGIIDKDLLTVTPNGSVPYNVPIQKPSIQRGQFYFLLKMNTSSGDYVTASAGIKKV